MRAHPFRFRWTALICYGVMVVTKNAHTFQISLGRQEACHPTGRPPSALFSKKVQGFAVHFLAIGECRVGGPWARQSDVEFQGG
jgi:hypothetical protein